MALEDEITRAEQAEKERDELKVHCRTIQAELDGEAQNNSDKLRALEQAEAKLKAVADELAETRWNPVGDLRAWANTGDGVNHARVMRALEAIRGTTETKTPGTGSGPAVTAVNVAESVTAEPDPVAELPYETADHLEAGVEYEVVECARYWSEKGARITATGDETSVTFRAEGILGWYRGFEDGLLRRVRRVTPKPAPELLGGHGPTHDVLERVKRLERLALDVVYPHARHESWKETDLKAMRADVAREDKS
jgi:hypothetical protein